MRVRSLMAGLGAAGLAFIAVGSGCAPHAGPPPRTAPPLESGGEPLFDEEAGEGEEEPLPEAAPEPENILDPATRPDWLGKPTSFGEYRGVTALIAIGSSKAEGELPLARLVARRRARTGYHQLGERLASYLGRRVRLGPDAIVLLQTQLESLLDLLLPDQRRFVPTWQDKSNGRIYAAILLPLDRLLQGIRDNDDIPEPVRELVLRNPDKVRTDLLANAR